MHCVSAILRGGEFPRFSLLDLSYIISFSTLGAGLRLSFWTILDTLAINAHPFLSYCYELSYTSALRRAKAA